MSRERMLKHERALVAAQNINQVIGVSLACAGDDGLTADEFVALYFNISKRYDAFLARGDRYTGPETSLLCKMG